MEMKIRYLDQLEEDLVKAAERERTWAAALETRRMRHVPWLGIAAGLVAFLLVAGLVGALIKGGSQESARPAAGSATGGPALDRSVRPGDQLHTAPNASPAPFLAPELNDLGSRAQQGGLADLTKIIRKGDVSVTVPRDGLGKAVDAVTAIADKEGGFVFSSSIGQRAGTLVLRVPAKRFDATVTALRGIGTVKDVTISADDLTAEFVDLQARLDIAEGRYKVLFGLYDKATTIEQTLRVQNALDDTQLRIEQIQGQLNVIENQTSQSTIRVSLREAGVRDPQPQDVRNPSVRNAWDRAIAGFFGVISAVVIGLGYLVPLAILALFVLLVVALARRRRRRASTEP